MVEIIKGKSKERRKLIKQENQEARSMFRELMGNNQQQITNNVNNTNEITSKLKEWSTVLIDRMEQIRGKIKTYSENREILLNAKLKIINYR